MGKSKEISFGILDSINKKHDTIDDVTKDVTNVRTNDITSDKTSDKISGNASDVTRSIKSYNISDILSDSESVNISDTQSDIQSDILKIVSKRSKYTDTHVRKTYYIENDLLKKVNKLVSKTNQDNSYIINQALRYFFKALENKK